MKAMTKILSSTELIELEFNASYRNRVDAGPE